VSAACEKDGFGVESVGKTQLRLRLYFLLSRPVLASKSDVVTFRLPKKPFNSSNLVLNKSQDNETGNVRDKRVSHRSELATLTISDNVACKMR